jgi:hypothetical protein
MEGPDEQHHPQGAREDDRRAREDRSGLQAKRGDRCPANQRHGAGWQGDPQRQRPLVGRTAGSRTRGLGCTGRHDSGRLSGDHSVAATRPIRRQTAAIATDHRRQRLLEKSGHALIDAVHRSPLNRSSKQRSAADGPPEGVLAWPKSSHGAGILLSVLECSIRFCSQMPWQVTCSI